MSERIANYPGDAERRIDVKEVAAAADPVPELIEKPRARAGEDRPSERAHQRRHVIGQLHQPLEPGAARHFRAGQDPGNDKSEQHRHHRRHGRDQRRIGEDVPLLGQRREIAEPPFL